MPRMILGKSEHVQCVLEPGDLILRRHDQPDVRDVVAGKLADVFAMARDVDLACGKAFEALRGTVQHFHEDGAAVSEREKVPPADGAEGKPKSWVHDCVVWSN